MLAAHKFQVYVFCLASFAMSRAGEPFVRAMVAGLSSLEQKIFPFGKPSGQPWFENKAEALRLALKLNSGNIMRRHLKQNCYLGVCSYECEM